MSNLLAAIRSACRKHDIPVTRFGREAVNDPRFVLDLANGRQARPETAARVHAYIAGRA